MTPRQMYEKMKGHLAVMGSPRYDILLPEGGRKFSMGSGLLLMRWFPRMPEGAHRPSFDEFCKAYDLETS